MPNDKAHLPRLVTSRIYNVPVPNHHMRLYGCAQLLESHMRDMFFEQGQKMDDYLL